MKQLRTLLTLLVGCFVNLLPAAAQVNPDNPNAGLTLEQCVNFALQNRPQVQQSRLDEEISEREIRANLSAWLPQVSAQYNVQHYMKMPVTLFSLDGGPPTPRTLGVANSSGLNFQANQTIFDTDVLLASRAARFIRLQSSQFTINTRIYTVIQVSKAFYDVLLTQEQLRILDEAIIRQEKQLHDARAQYEQGLVDKTDYQRSMITLSNTRSERKRSLESIKYKTTYLKQLMGYTPENNLQLAFDRPQMEQDILIDTTQGVTFANRIEFQQLQTQKQLQSLNINYYRYGFLPSVSAFANYNFNYQNNQFSELYSQSFPNSQVGLSVAVPIFQGTRRIQNYRRAQLLDRRLDLDIIETRNQISTEYDQALASYKSDLNEWNTTKNNVALAEDVYRIIHLQYNEGIKSYLDLITAEYDLQITQLNYYNALFQVLSSKLDMERARGIVSIE